MDSAGTPMTATLRPGPARWLATLPLAAGVTGIVLVAFRGSWGALRDAALAAHFDQDSASLYPFAVDGLLVIAVVSAVLLRHDRGARRYCLGIVGAYTGASWLVNFLHGLGMFAVDPDTGARPGPPWPVVFVIASLVIGSIFLGSHLLVFVWRHLFPDHDETGPRRPRPVICSGPHGIVFLRRPTPLLKTEPEGPVGTPITDVSAILGRSHAPIVYFVRNGNRVKIGTTRNLRSRISTLCLRIDDVLLVLHGGPDYESALHERFADYRIGSSEWFKLSGSLTAFIADPQEEVGQLGTVPYQDGTSVPERPVVPADKIAAARLAYRQSLAPGMLPLSQRTMVDRFGLSKRQASQVQHEVKQELGGQFAEAPEDALPDEAPEPSPNGHAPSLERGDP